MLTGLRDRIRAGIGDVTSRNQWDNRVEWYREVQPRCSWPPLWPDTRSHELFDIPFVPLYESMEVPGCS